MLQRSVCLAVLVCSLMCRVSLASAADIAFFPAEGQNVLAADAIAVGELLAEAYAASSQRAVLAPSRSAQTLAESSSYEAAARALGVAEFVRTSALAVGRRIVVTATRYRVEAGGSAANEEGANLRRIYQESLIADSPEDLVPVCDRLAKALYSQRSDELVRDHGNVTMTEARPQNRIWREKVFGLRTGVHVPFARDATFSAAVSLEFDLRLEHARYFVEFGAGAVIPTRVDSDEYDEDGSYVSSGSSNGGSTGGLFGEVGASRFLTDGDLGLYAGAGVIPKIMFSDRDAAGMALYGQLGLSLPRSSATRFCTDLRFAQSVLAQHLNDERRVFPSEASLLAGVGW